MRSGRFRQMLRAQFVEPRFGRFQAAPGLHRTIVLSGTLEKKRLSLQGLQCLGERRGGDAMQRFVVRHGAGRLAGIECLQ